MKLASFIIAAAVPLSAAVGIAGEAADKSTATPALAKKLEEWRAARFGLFIHWGPVALKGTEIGWSRGDQFPVGQWKQVPIEEYDNLYKQFNPTKFDADQWMKLAHDAGMKYVVFTAKHHDGFCMWDTKQIDYNIMNSPFGRDIVGELAAAAKRQGLAFGAYYSTSDFYHPDFPVTSPGGMVHRETSNLDRYEAYLQAQVAELIRQYGPLWELWFDMPQEYNADRGQGVIDYVRSLQPDLLVNDRSGARGDFDTPEQKVGKYNTERPWETNMTICQQWSWKPGDKLKSLSQCVQTLVRCAGGDGNLLLNVGPMPDGRIEPRQADRLREIGQWLSQYGESIYGTRGGPWKRNPRIVSTRKGNFIYVHVLRWEGDRVRLPSIDARILDCKVLTGGTADVQQTGGSVIISMAPADQQKIDTIIRLELDKPAMEISPVEQSVH